MNGTLPHSTSSVAARCVARRPLLLVEIFAKLNVEGPRLLYPVRDIHAGLLNGVWSALKRRGPKKTTGNKLGRGDAIVQRTFDYESEKLGFAFLLFYKDIFYLPLLHDFEVVHICCTGSNYNIEFDCLGYVCTLALVIRAIAVRRVDNGAMILYLSKTTNSMLSLMTASERLYQEREIFQHVCPPIHNILICFSLCGAAALAARLVAAGAA